MRERWRIILNTAGAQHGVVTQQQLQKAGYSGESVRTRVRNGELSKPYPRVFVLGGYPSSFKTRAMAVSLFCDGKITGSTSSVLWNVKQRSSVDAEIHVAVDPARRVRPQPGVKVLRSRTWELREPTERFGIPTVGLRLTLLELAKTSDFTDFRFCLNEARRKHKLDLVDFLEFLEEAMQTRQQGSERLREILQRAGELQRLSLSEWSELVADACVEVGIPRPLVEYVIIDVDGVKVATVDLCWPQFRVAVELDSLEFHFDHETFERDRNRFSLMSLNGYTLLIMTAKSLREDRSEQLRRIRRALTDNGWDGFTTEQRAVS